MCIRDRTKNVEKNLLLVAEKMKVKRTNLILMHQTHSNKVIEIKKDFSRRKVKSDAIITKNKMSAKKFLKNVKSSIAIHNASTQFADGGEFGFGGEVGISTNKLPPRGPVGINQLTSYKYIVSGKGIIRP